MRRTTVCAIVSLTLIGCSQHLTIDMSFQSEMPLYKMHRDAHGHLDSVPWERLEGSVPLFEVPAEGYQDIRFETELTSFRLFDGELRVWHQGTGCFRMVPQPKTLMHGVLVDLFAIFGKILDEIDFWAMEPSYAVLASHSEINYIFAKKSGVSKVVWNYGTPGPVELWLYGQYFLYQMELLLEIEYRKYPHPSILTATECIEGESQ